VDKAIRTNAKNCEERKKFLSHQNLCVKWTSHLTRKAPSLKADKNSKSKGKMKGRGEKGRGFLLGCAGLSMMENANK
jgi:hypothetical protein